ncbi:MAG: pilus assembly protein [Proteobacteria bacterium]|nr:pilus assembly protein [Pseudomonadota bacterium]
MRIRPLACLRHFARRFARAEGGVTAVEFALVSVPLFLMIFGTLELALIFMATSGLDAATQLASRQIRTGQFQATGGGLAQFKTLLCQNMGFMQSDCAANVYLDVRTFGDFSDLAGASPLTPANAATTAFCFQPGQPTDIVLVRVFYQYSLMTPGFSSAFSNLGGTRRLITSTTAFRNEPFNNNPAQGASGCAPLA